MVELNSPNKIANDVVEKYRLKTTTSIVTLIILGILGGAYIGMGSTLYALVTSDLSKFVGLGFAKLMGGIVFSVGLILIVLCGGELFTGNCLLIAPRMQKKIKTKDILKNWTIVYLTNFIGCMIFVFLIYFSGIAKTGNYMLAENFIHIATAKTNNPFYVTMIKGILANWLVCLAIWLSMAGRTMSEKIIGITIPVATFVALGFEHSIANMFLIPMGILYNTSIETLNWSSFFITNLIPTTIGNIIGGAVMVGLVYYFVYLYKK